jgi:hypothetical protein
MFILKDPKIKRFLFSKKQYLKKKISPYIWARTELHQFESLDQSSGS